MDMHETGRRKRNRKTDMQGTERKSGKETERWICTRLEERKENKQKIGYARDWKKKRKRSRKMDRQVIEREKRKRNRQMDMHGTRRRGKRVPKNSNAHGQNEC